MIIVYPMLTSASVSPNILPGLVKAVEKYILLYNTDDVLKSAGVSVKSVVAAGAVEVGKQAAVAAAKQAATTAVAAMRVNRKGQFFIDESYQQEQSLKQKAIDAAKKAAMDTASKEVEKAGKSEKPDKITPKLDLPRYDAISIEPTWLQVTTKRKGLQILGVKVVPFRVTSSANMVQMFMSDKNIKILDYLQKKYSRIVLRIVFRALRGIRISNN